MQAFVIGDLAMVTGFRLVGVRGKAVHSVDAAKEELAKAVENVDVGIIVISEEFSVRMRNAIENIRLKHISPLIVEMLASPDSPEEFRLADSLRGVMGIGAQEHYDVRD